MNSIALAYLSLFLKKGLFACCKQSLTWLYHPPIHQSTHPPIQRHTLFRKKWAYDDFLYKYAHFMRNVIFDSCLFITRPFNAINNHFQDSLLVWKALNFQTTLSYFFQLFFRLFSTLLNFFQLFYLSMHYLKNYIFVNYSSQYVK